MMMSHTDALARLTQLNTNDMLESFGLHRVRRGRWLLQTACYWPARRFAQTVLAFDGRVASQGLPAAAIWGVQQFAAGLDVHGRDQVPAQGPVLFLANHPGLTDTLALFSALGRPDLHTVAAIRPFLTALDNMARQLIFVPEDASAQLPVVRAVTSHLRQGGAVLTFPAGRIEPDPAVLPGAAEALAGWSDSASLFLRLVPAAWVVPVLVSGVYSARSLRNPLIRLRRRRQDQERLAAMLQLLLPQLFPARVRVTIGAPMAGADLLALGSAQAVKARVVAAMADLLQPGAAAAHGPAGSSATSAR